MEIYVAYLIKEIPRIHIDPYKFKAIGSLLFVSLFASALAARTATPVLSPYSGFNNTRSNRGDYPNC